VRLYRPSPTEDRRREVRGAWLRPDLSGVRRRSAFVELNEGMLHMIVEVTTGHLRRTVIVTDAAERRVSAAEAAKLYGETEQSVTQRERQAELRRLGGPVDLGGRPTKRDRRRFDAGQR
jgi:hypothetical protein